MIKQRIKEDKKAIERIKKVFQENQRKKTYEELEFTIILLLIIEGKLELSKAQSTFLNWYNGGSF